MWKCTHTHTHVRKKRYTWLPDVSIKSTRQSTNFLTLKVKSRFFLLCLLPRNFSPIFSRSYALLVFTRCVEMRSLYSSLFFLRGSEREVLCDTIACGTTASTLESLFFSLSPRRALSRTHAHTHRGQEICLLFCTISWPNIQDTDGVGFTAALSSFSTPNRRAARISRNSRKRELFYFYLRLWR